jgi:hypothetical protein
MNFVFWNVLGVLGAGARTHCSPFFAVRSSRPLALDDYCTHDCVDALRRLGVPHNRQSLVYRLACGWVR